MLLIGIDEAGYGPLLGPLCHGYAAFRLDDDEPWPDLWERLHPAVSKCGKAAPPHAVLVDDSKRLHNPAAGYAPLAESVSAFLSCIAARTAAATLETLLPDADRDDLAQDHWHGVAAPATAAPKHTPALRQTLTDRRVEIVTLGARATSVRRFNAAISAGQNKAGASWSVIVEIVRSLRSHARPGEALAIVIDRQGGRRRYAAPLAEVFGAALIQPLAETASDAVYRLDDQGQSIHVGFFVSGDSRHLPIALASLCAKLAREQCMERLNAYFRAHAPALAPTAGYYNDAKRFLKDTAELRGRLGISDDRFIRAR